MRWGMVLVLADCVHREMNPLGDASCAAALGNERSSRTVVREGAPGCKIEGKEVGGFAEQRDAAIVAMDLEARRSNLVEEREIKTLDSGHAHSRCAGIVG